MCIVSLYVGDSFDFVLTHNRDEKIHRPFSETPVEQQVHGQLICGPVDLKAQGTWIFMGEQYVSCILNGAFQKHLPQPPYRMSRGVLLYEVLKYASAEKYLDQINFSEIEPFTQIIIDRKYQKIYKTVWDGKQKHLEEVTSPILVHSSATLYKDETKQYHANALTAAIKQSHAPETLSAMHHELKMKLGDVHPEIKTTSITQIIAEKGEIMIKYQYLP